MAKKISVYVTIPDIYQSYNFLIPDSMQIDSVQRLICKMLNRIDKNTLVSSDYKMVSVECGMVIPSTYTMDKAGIIDGASLLMIKER